jgi:hypothetical protein
VEADWISRLERRNGSWCRGDKGVAAAQSAVLPRQFRRFISGKPYAAWRTGRIVYFYWNIFLGLRIGRFADKFARIARVTFC